MTSGSGCLALRIKLQTDNDLSREKVDSVEKKEKMKRNLELFNSLVNADDNKQQKDECINSVACDGDCDNVNELRRLGSSRVCPQTKPQDKPLLKCDMCDFISQNKDYMSIQIKKHEEKKIASNVAKPCRFVNTERGCLKGDSCNFSHSKAAIAPHVKKFQSCAEIKKHVCGNLNVDTYTLRMESLYLLALEGRVLESTTSVSSPLDGAAFLLLLLPTPAPLFHLKKTNNYRWNWKREQM